MVKEMAVSLQEKPDTEMAELIFDSNSDALNQAQLLHELVHNYKARILSRNLSDHSSLYNLNLDGITLLLYYTAEKSHRLAGRGQEARKLLSKIAQRFSNSHLV